jgi:hypothetical protein
MSDSAPEASNERVSLVSLLKRIPQQISRLVRDEITAARLELTTKVKAAGIGAGLIVGGVVFALFALGVLIGAAVSALALVLALWLAQLIVGVVLLVVAGILAMIGINKLKKGVPPLPTDSIESVKADIRTVKGINGKSLR